MIHRIFPSQLQELENKRGMGYGKRMIHMAIRYAFDMLKAEKITVWIF